MTKKPCKEHSGCLNPGGYGVVRHNGKTELAHRVAYCASHGKPIESINGRVIRHTCDNRRCVEPSHLLIGTQADNVHDMLDRGRNSPPPHHSGDKHSMAKLTYADVKSIRAEYLAGTKQIDLARKFNVSPQNINYIVKHKTWDERVREINARIAPLKIDADGLAQLGFNPVGTERAAKLYNERDWPAICDAMMARIVSASTNAARAA